MCAVINEFHLTSVGENPNISEPSCRVLRHVKLKFSTNELFYIDDSFDLAYSLGLKLNEEPTQENFIQLVKDLNKGNRVYRKYLNHKKNSTVVGVLGFAGLAGTAAGLLINGIVVGAVATGPFLLVWVGALGVVFGVQELALRPVLPQRGVISHVMANQNEWNWSIQPKRISYRSFHYFERYLSDH